MHLFAGIGGWPLALRMVGWPDDREVWTGSCPCQPFSVAGSKGGEDDSRHLWPHFRRLIAERGPAVVFGEQVSSPLGRQWLSRVRADLEELGYGVGATDLCAAGIGAPHIRQRLWWGANRMADTGSATSERNAGGFSSSQAGIDRPREQDGRVIDRFGDGGPDHSGVADTECNGAGRTEGQSGSILPCTSDEGTRKDDVQPGANGTFTDGVGVTEREGSQGWGSLHTNEQDKRKAWNASEAVLDNRGRWRRVEPGTFPLAHGVSQRVGRIRAYDNAIVPQVAAVFIESYMETIDTFARHMLPCPTYTQGGGDNG